MTMKVLAATDGSRGGAAAVRFAARLIAADPDGRLVVLTVARADPRAPERRDDARIRAEKILERAARRLKSRAPKAEFCIIAPRNGTAVPEAISREADRIKADIVIVGSEGRDTLNEWVLGGTALRLVYVSRRPVTVVRPPRRRKTA